MLLAPFDLISVTSAVPDTLILLAPCDVHERDEHSADSSISLFPLL